MCRRNRAYLVSAAFKYRSGCAAPTYFTNFVNFRSCTLVIHHQRCGDQCRLAESFGSLPQSFVCNAARMKRVATLVVVVAVVCGVLNALHVTAAASGSGSKRGRHAPPAVHAVGGKSGRVNHHPQPPAQHSVCDAAWYYRPRDPGCANYTMRYANQGFVATQLVNMADTNTPPTPAYTK